MIARPKGRERPDALHESAHAVTAHVLNHRVISLDLHDQADGTRGQCRYKRRGDARCEVVILVAGLVGETLAGAGSAALCFHSDNADAQKLVRKITGRRGKAITREVYTEAIEAASDILIKNWLAVEAVARVLQRDQQMTGAEFLKILSFNPPARRRRKT